MAQIKPVTSEDLQATIRRLLPSQNGFTEDLEAQNVIVPTIDLTRTAEGTQLESYLQQAISVANSTSFVVQNATTDLASNPGFWIITGSINCTSANNGQIRIGTSASMNSMITLLGGSNTSQISFSKLVFLDTNDKVDATSNGAGAYIDGQYWQIADRYGVLNNPGGFTFQ